jgi:hypothetical protein
MVLGALVAIKGFIDMAELFLIKRRPPSSWLLSLIAVFFILNSILSLNDRENKTTLPVMIPSHIRLITNSYVTLELPYNTQFLSLHCSNGIVSAISVYLRKGNWSSRLIPERGAYLNHLSKCKAPLLVRFNILDNRMKWRLNSITAQSEYIDLDTIVKGHRYKKRIYLDVVPALLSRFGIYQTKLCYKSLLIFFSLLSAEGLPVEPSDQIRIWINDGRHIINAKAINSPSTIWKAVVPYQAINRLLVASTHLNGWRDNSIKFRIVKVNSYPFVHVVETAQPYNIVIPNDFLHWRRIGPHYPASFHFTSANPHDTVAVYTQSKTIAFYRAHGYFPIHAMFVKVSRPIADKAQSRPSKNKSSFYFIESSEFVGGSRPNWLYGASLVRALPIKQPIRQYPLQTLECYTCHYQRGVHNVFTMRYPDLQFSRE